MLIRTAHFYLLRTLGQGLLLALALAVLCATLPAQNDEGQKRVLILYSSDSNLPAQVILERALRSTLQTRSPVPVEIYSEYLDDARTGIGNYETELVGLLKRKYEGRKFDVIFTVTDPVLRMLLRNEAKLFPGTPVVFLTHDEITLAGLELGPNVTGVWGDISFKSNLELALALHPGTEQVVVIAGVSDWDKYWTARAQKDYRAFEPGLKFTYLIGLSKAEQQKALADLPPHTVVSFVTSVRDSAGSTYVNSDLLTQISPTSTAPVYGTTDSQLGSGIVGGRLLSFEALGVDGARVGLRVMAGEKPAAIAPHGIQGVAMFDSRQLQRWNVSEESLPEGSIVQFKQPSVWEEYKWYAIGLLAALIAETFLIAWLIFVRIRRRQAEAEKVHLTNRIKEIVSNVPGIVWETRTDPVTNLQLTTFISDYVEKMTGYSAAEWLAEPPGFGLRRTVEEDRERAIQDNEAVIESGKVGVSEFRSRTKDGRIQWIENHLSPIFDGDEKVVGMRGVALDVTNRKLAEEKARETEQKDRAILAAIPDLMFLQSDDGVFLDYHAKEPGELLASPEAFLGKNMREVLPPDLAEQFADRFERAEEGGDPEILEYSLERGDSNRWYEARMVRIGDKILSVVRDITDARRAEQEAQELSGRLITAQEDERSRIARELHDDACQNLAVLAIELEIFGQKAGGENGSANGAWKKLSSRISNIAGDLHRLSHELHPAKLEQLGLSSSIRGFCREVQSAHGLDVEFVEKDVPRNLPATTSLCVYRIVQESLQNVVKHSGATVAKVILTANGEGLRLTVTDNGRGFDPRVSGENSLGLVSMKERIRLLNGSISIESTRDGGTRIEATIPT